jgi:hypothetical protein
VVVAVVGSEREVKLVVVVLAFATPCPFLLPLLKVHLLSGGIVSVVWALVGSLQALVIIGVDKVKAV